MFQQESRLIRLHNTYVKFDNYIHMGVSKNKGTPKWMVKIMENPIKIDNLGVPLFLETTIFQIPKLRYLLQVFF